MRVLFLDCASGISGDMTVGALCDLGVKPSTLEWELSKLEIGDFHMHFVRESRHSVEGVHFSIHEGAVHVHAEGTQKCSHEHPHSHGDGHSHSHEHSHEGQEHDECCHDHSHEGHSHEGHSDCKHEHGEGHGHSHESIPAEKHAHEDSHVHEGEEHEECGHGHHHEKGAGDEPTGEDGEAADRPRVHDQDHGSEIEHAKARHAALEHKHGHGHHGHDHTHGRNHREIRKLIEESGLSAFVKKHALSIFQRIAVAEGKIHGMPAADVAFHEVGALDSIADIICVCVGMEALGIERVYVSSLHEGHGWVDCAHGRFPLPAPATFEILKGIPLGQIDERHELITPTGAAIVAEFGHSFGLMPRIAAEKIGYGVGTRNLSERPNVLRAVIGKLSEA